jgi:hypothetical protein
VGDLKGDIFQFSLVPIMLTIPPSAHFGWPKMVINFFWKEKFHAANGKAQAHTECALHFFLLNLGGAGFRGGYFSGFPGSITLTIPHHPLTLSGALKAKGGGVGEGGLEPIMNYRFKPPTPISL